MKLSDKIKKLILLDELIGKNISYLKDEAEYTYDDHREVRQGIEEIRKDVTGKVRFDMDEEYGGYIDFD